MREQLANELLPLVRLSKLGEEQCVHVATEVVGMRRGRVAHERGRQLQLHSVVRPERDTVGEDGRAQQLGPEQRFGAAVDEPLGRARLALRIACGSERHEQPPVEWRVLGRLLERLELAEKEAAKLGAHAQRREECVENERLAGTRGTHCVPLRRCLIGPRKWQDTVGGRVGEELGR